MRLIFVLTAIIAYAHPKIFIDETTVGPIELEQGHVIYISIVPQHPSQWVCQTHSMSLETYAPLGFINPISGDREYPLHCSGDCPVGSIHHVEFDSITPRSGFDSGPPEAWEIKIEIKIV